MGSNPTGRTNRACARLLWSAKIIVVVRRPPSPGDTHDASRPAQTSSQHSNRRAACVCGRWPEHGPSWVPALQDLTYSTGRRFIRFHGLHSSGLSRDDSSEESIKRETTSFCLGDKVCLSFRWEFQCDRHRCLFQHRTFSRRNGNDRQSHPAACPNGLSSRLRADTTKDVLHVTIAPPTIAISQPV